MAYNDELGGRPSKYKPEYAEQAYKLCLLGATDEDIAKFFDVKEQTVNNWKKAHPEFFESLKRGKLIADAEVADSLYKRATGYEHKETKVFNNQGEILTHDVTKHYAPDPTAIAYWLNNRQRSKWAQRQSIEQTSVNTNIEVPEGATADEAAKMYKEFMQSSK